MTLFQVYSDRPLPRTLPYRVFAYLVISHVLCPLEKVYTGGPLTEMSFSRLNQSLVHMFREAITPLFGPPDSNLFRGYSVCRTLLCGMPTKVQMVRVRRILCSARKKSVNKRYKTTEHFCIKRIDRKSAHIFSRSLALLYFDV